MSYCRLLNTLLLIACTVCYFIFSKNYANAERFNQYENHNSEFTAPEFNRAYNCRISEQPPVNLFANHSIQLIANSTLVSMEYGDSGFSLRSSEASKGLFCAKYYPDTVFGEYSTDISFDDTDDSDSFNILQLFLPPFSNSDKPPSPTKTPDTDDSPKFSPPYPTGQPFPPGSEALLKPYESLIKTDLFRSAIQIKNRLFDLAFEAFSFGASFQIPPPSLQPSQYSGLAEIESSHTSPNRAKPDSFIVIHDNSGNGRTQITRHTRNRKPAEDIPPGTSVLREIEPFLKPWRKCRLITPASPDAPDIGRIPSLPWNYILVETDVETKDNMEEETKQEGRNLRLIRRDRRMLQALEKEAAEAEIIEDRNLRLIRQNREMLQQTEDEQWFRILSEVLTALPEHSENQEGVVTMADRPPQNQPNPPSSADNDNTDNDSDDSSSDSDDEEKNDSDKDEADNHDNQGEDDPVKEKPEKHDARSRDPRQCQMTYLLSEALHDLDPASPKFAQLLSLIQDSSRSGDLTKIFEELYQTLMASYQKNPDLPPVAVQQNMANLRSVHARQQVNSTPSEEADSLWFFHEALIKFAYQEYRQYSLIWALAQINNLPLLHKILQAATQNPENPTLNRRLSLRKPTRISTPVLSQLPEQPSELLSQTAVFQLSGPEQLNVPVHFAIRQNGELLAGNPEDRTPDHANSARTKHVQGVLSESRVLQLLTRPRDFFDLTNNVQGQITRDLFRASIVITVETEPAEGLQSPMSFRVFDSKKVAQRIKRQAGSKKDRFRPRLGSLGSLGRNREIAKNDIDPLVHYRFNHTFRDAMILTHSDSQEVMLMVASYATQGLGNDISLITMDDARYLNPSASNANHDLFVSRSLHSSNLQLNLFDGFNKLTHQRGLGALNKKELGKWQSQAKGGLWVSTRLAQHPDGHYYGEKIFWLYDVQTLTLIAGLEDTDSSLAESEPVNPLTGDELQTEIISLYSQYSEAPKESDMTEEDDRRNTYPLRTTRSDESLSKGCSRPVSGDHTDRHQQITPWAEENPLLQWRSPQACSFSEELERCLDQIMSRSSILPGILSSSSCPSGTFGPDVNDAPSNKRASLELIRSISEPVITDEMNRKEKP